MDAAALDVFLMDIPTHHNAIIIIPLLSRQGRSDNENKRAFFIYLFLTARIEEMKMPMLARVRLYCVDGI